MGSAAEVTAADIARLAGVGRAAVSNWRRRFRDFPEPVGGTPTSPFFRLDEVERWLRHNNRLPDVDPLDELWLAVQQAGPIDEIMRQVGDTLATGKRGLGVQDAADGPGIDGTRLRQAVDAAIEDTEPAEVFEFLLERYLDQQSRRGTGDPPQAVCDLIAGMVDMAGATVLDPSCSSGALLRAAAARGAVTLLGQSAEPDLAALADERLTLTLATHGGLAEIRHGTLREDAFPEVSADVVLVRPPYAQRDWGYDELTFDPRWEYEMPPRGESELAWVQHALARLRPGGHAVLLLPPSVASRSAGRRIRTALLRRGALRCIVALPPGTVSFTHLSLHVWVLRRPVQSAVPSDVLLVDATSLPWPDGAVEIRDEVAAYLAGEPVEAVIARAVPLIDLLGDAIDLSPIRHLAGAAPAASPQEVRAERADLAAMLAALPGMLPDPCDGAGLPHAGPRWTTVGDLIRDGRLTVHHLPDVRAQVGDVVVTTSGAPRATVASGADDPAETSGLRMLLRPDPEHLDPWFLAGFVCRESNIREIASLGSSRLDIRRAQVPLLPLERQYEYGIWFRQLDEFDRAVQAAATRSSAVVHLIAESLARGTLSSQGSQAVERDRKDRETS